jgi:hypothetical protein
MIRKLICYTTGIIVGICIAHGTMADSFFICFIPVLIGAVIFSIIVYTEGVEDDRSND